MSNEAVNFELPIVRIQLIKDQPLISEKDVASISDAKELVRNLISDSDREVFCVLNLTCDYVPISAHIAAVGTLNSLELNPRDVFKGSILSNAAGVVLFHNHPSGSVRPTREDFLTTEIMVDCGDLLGIPVVDHIIIGGGNNRTYSFKENDQLRRTYEQIKREKREHER